MSRWVIKWNRHDASLPQKANDWAVAMNTARPIECFGRAEGRGGETLAALSAGNVALAYQTDDRAFYGVVRVLSVHSSTRPAYLTLERVHRFARPIKFAELPSSPLLDDADAFRTGSASDSLRRLRPDEYRLICEGCGLDAALRDRLKI